MVFFVFVVVLFAESYEFYPAKAQRGKGAKKRYYYVFIKLHYFILIIMCALYKDGSLLSTEFFEIRRYFIPQRRRGAKKRRD